MAEQIETILKHAARSVGEGPHWVESTQSLLYVDIADGDIHRWDSKTNNDEKVTMGTHVGFVIPHSNGGYVAGVGKKIVHFQWDSPQQGKVIAEVDKDQPINRFNDAKCDRKGRLFAGTMMIDDAHSDQVPDSGNLYRLDGDGSLTLLKDKVFISNGLAWSLDNKTMYYIDSMPYPSRLYAFDYDVDTGNIANQRTLLTYDKENGILDGMTMDSDGNLWVAIFGASKIIHVDSKTGSILREVVLPAKNITSCCFGGKNYDELYATSCVFDGGNPRDMDPLAGSVFRIKGLGCKGMPPNDYVGQ
ncbi:regucalcin-like isoform X2 [Lineus longissimus]|uniref:regucalcin-like isoform X2 n=1 Tax=Lineus longissimus TaxID=88925 RepID=UPI002B4E6D6F